MGAGNCAGTAATAASFRGVYPDAAARQTRATLIASNPATIALSGPGYGLDDHTFGAMMTNEMLGMTCVLVAIMASLLVVRRTRGDEEAGRAELMRAGIVGRHASGGASLIVGVGASLAVGLLSAVGLGLLGIESIDWSGSLLYGAALAGTGIAFAAIGLAVAQVSEHASRRRVSRACSSRRRTRYARSGTWANRLEPSSIAPTLAASAMPRMDWPASTRSSAAAAGLVSPSCHGHDGVDEFGRNAYTRRKSVR